MIVNVTEDYRFTVEERQYSLQRRHIVDPTRAPNYKPDPTKPAPEPREEWRNADLFYSANAAGLTTLLQYVAHRSLPDEQVDLSKYIRLITDEYSRLRATVEEGKAVMNDGTDQVTE